MKLRDPAKKKELELEHDHRVLPRLGNKTFRKAWPLRKARTNRRVRRKAAAVASGILSDADHIDQQVAEAESMHRYRHLKEGVRTLGGRLALQKNLSLRWSTQGWVDNPARHAFKSRLKKAGG